MPPLVLAQIVIDLPLHAEVFPAMSTINGGPKLIQVCELAVHPLASVTVTVKQEEATGVIVAMLVVAPVFQLYAKGAVPPVTVAVNVPAVFIQRVAGPLATTVIGCGWVMVTDTVDWQPLASVTVIV